MSRKQAIATGKTPKGFQQALRALIFVISVAGIFLFFSGIVEIIRINQIKKWPTTTGKIEAVNIKTEVKVRGGIDGNHPMYIPVVVVKFKYYLNGKEYALNKKLRNQDFASPKEFVKQYPAGKEITVYYNPRNYQDAEFLAGSSLAGCFSSIVGLFLFLTGILIFRNSRKYANH